MMSCYGKSLHNYRLMLKGPWNMKIGPDKRTKSGMTLQDIGILNNGASNQIKYVV